MMKTISPLTSRGKNTKKTPARPSVASQSSGLQPRKSASNMDRKILVEGAEDVVAVEEPLEIRVDGRALAVTMRTPGHDEELALGFLHGEGLIDAAREAGPTEDLAANTVEVRGPLLRDPGERRFYTTSSCGVCGKGALEQVAVDAPALPSDGGPHIDRALLAT